MTYEYQHLGESPSVLKSLSSGSGFAQKLRQAKKPLIIVGADSLKRPDGAAILQAVQLLANGLQSNVQTKDWRVLNVLHKVASQVTLHYLLIMVQF